MAVADYHPNRILLTPKESAMLDELHVEFTATSGEEAAADVFDTMIYCAGLTYMHSLYKARGELRS